MDLRTEVGRRLAELEQRLGTQLELRFSGIDTRINALAEKLASIGAVRDIHMPLAAAAALPPWPLDLPAMVGLDQDCLHTPPSLPQMAYCSDDIPTVRRAIVHDNAYICDCLKSACMCDSHIEYMCD